MIGLCNIAIPFVLIAIGTAKINSYLAAILMSTTPLSGSILAHFFTNNEKLSFPKSLGVLIGFSGIILLFFDKVILKIALKKDLTFSIYKENVTPKIIPKLIIGRKTIFKIKISMTPTLIIW